MVVLASLASERPASRPSWPGTMEVAGCLQGAAHVASGNPHEKIKASLAKKAAEARMFVVGFSYKWWWCRLV